MEIKVYGSIAEDAAGQKHSWSPVDVCLNLSRKLDVAKMESKKMDCIIGCVTQVTSLKSIVPMLSYHAPPTWE